MAYQKQEKESNSAIWAVALAFFALGMNVAVLLLALSK